MGKVDVAGILRRDPVSGTVEIHRDEARTIVRYVANLERKLAESERMREALGEIADNGFCAEHGPHDWCGVCIARRALATTEEPSDG